MCLWCIYHIYLFHHVYWKEKAAWGAAWGCSTSLSGSIIIQLHHRNLQFHESTVGRTWVVHRTCEISSSFIACNFRYTWRIWINLTNVPSLDPIGSYWRMISDKPRSAPSRVGSIASLDVSLVSILSLRQDGISVESIGKLETIVPEYIYYTYGGCIYNIYIYIPYIYIYINK